MRETKEIILVGPRSDSVMPLAGSERQGSTSPPESEPVALGAAPPQDMVERLKDYGQEDSFSLWDEISPEEREILFRDIEVS
jgi:hypothetical protein